PPPSAPARRPGIAPAGPTVPGSRPRPPPAASPPAMQIPETGCATCDGPSSDVQSGAVLRLVSNSVRACAGVGAPPDPADPGHGAGPAAQPLSSPDRKSTRLNSSHVK